MQPCCWQPTGKDGWVKAEEGMTYNTTLTSVTDTSRTFSVWTKPLIAVNVLTDHRTQLV